MTKLRATNGETLSLEGARRLSANNCIALRISTNIVGIPTEEEVTRLVETSGLTVADPARCGLASNWYFLDDERAVGEPRARGFGLVVVRTLRCLKLLQECRQGKEVIQEDGSYKYVGIAEDDDGSRRPVGTTVTVGATAISVDQEMSASYTAACIRWWLNSLRYEYGWVGETEVSFSSGIQRSRAGQRVTGTTFHIRATSIALVEEIRSTMEGKHELVYSDWGWDKEGSRTMTLSRNFFGAVLRAAYLR